MLKADGNHVVGFRTWQEAMQAGYRPDPVSRPEPGAQIVHLAKLTPQSKALQRFVEFVQGFGAGAQRAGRTATKAG